MKYFEKGGNTALLHNITAALSNLEVTKAVLGDFTTTFNKIGLKQGDARALAMIVVSEMSAHEYGGILEMEEYVDTELKKFGVPEKLKSKLAERTLLIISQLAPHLSGITGKVMDFGAGSGLVAQGLHDRLGLDIEALDVRDFKSPAVAVKFHQFNGTEAPVPPKYYEAAVLTNVIHHEEDNEKILKELDRIVSKRLVLIETMAAEDTKEEWQRTFLNDVLWNRFFNHADIPVPGTYENVDGWINRFAAYGWKCSHSEDLGYDQPTITDIHHLFVFDRP
ncbi:MAG: class I SAM-dependent methyltransferase [Candidatus Micrarchaeota archaeon]|nr:class I SAM-dependent methyltransferase [Candidatus Micrarchaeota archaeon]